MSDRNKLIYERYKNGETLITLAEEYGVTKQRIHQICVLENIKCMMDETEDMLLKLVYKYSKNYSDLYMLTTIFEDNNIKTVFDLDSVSVDDIIVKRWYYVPGERRVKLITQVKNKAHVIVKKTKL